MVEKEVKNTSEILSTVSNFTLALKRMKSAFVQIGKNYNFA